jgi:hypothetical protein
MGTRRCRGRRVSCPPLTVLFVAHFVTRVPAWHHAAEALGARARNIPPDPSKLVLAPPLGAIGNHSTSPRCCHPYHALSGPHTGEARHLHHAAKGQLFISRWHALACDVTQSSEYGGEALRGYVVNMVVNCYGSYAAVFIKYHLIS